MRESRLLRRVGDTSPTCPAASTTLGRAPPTTSGGVGIRLPSQSAGCVLLRTRVVPDMLGGERGALDIEDPLKLVLVLVIVYIAVDLAFEVIGFVFGPLSNLVGLVIIVPIVARFLDYI